MSLESSNNHRSIALQIGMLVDPECRERVGWQDCPLVRFDGWLMFR